MESRSVLILLSILVLSVPAFYVNRLLQRVIKPRESFVRLLSYFILVFVLIVLYTFLVVWAITQVFPRPLK